MYRVTHIACLSGLLVLCFCLTGCGTLGEYSGVKRVGDRVTAQDIAAFLAVVDSLPGKKLPPLTGVIPVPPQWSSGRTLPVRELMHEEQKAIGERLTVSAVMAELPHPKHLYRVLRREGLTFEQFASLVVVLGAALNRTALTTDGVLETIEKKGKVPLQSLEADTRVFSDLTDEHEFVVLDRASWIPAAARMQWLRQVPPENLVLVRKNLEQLKAVFPAEFTTDPFARFGRMLNDEGTPFEERPTTETDEVVTWDPADEIRGSPVGTVRGATDLVR